MGDAVLAKKLERHADLEFMQFVLRKGCERLPSQAVAPYP